MTDQLPPAEGITVTHYRGNDCGTRIPRRGQIPTDRCLGRATEGSRPGRQRLYRRIDDGLHGDARRAPARSLGTRNDRPGRLGGRDRIRRGHPRAPRSAPKNAAIPSSLRPHARSHECCWYRAKWLDALSRAAALTLLRNFTARRRFRRCQVGMTRTI